MDLDRPTNNFNETKVNDKEDFTEKFLSYSQKLAERQNLGEEILTDATEMVEGLPSTSQQHYKAKHMAAASLVIASRVNEDPRTINQMAQVLEDMNGFMEYDEHIQETRRAKKKLEDSNNLDLKPVLADDFLDVVLRQLDAEKALKDACRRKMEELKGSHKLYGRSQIAVAASIVKISTREEDGLREIGSKKLADVAARNRKTIEDTARMIKSELKGED